MDRNKARLLVEIVGPSGAGKSTLTKMLVQRGGSQIQEDQGLIPGSVGYSTFLHINTTRPSRKEIEAFLETQTRNVPHLAWSGLGLLPRVAVNYRGPGRLSWTDVKEMIYLDALYKVSRNGISNGAPIRVMDQGPVFLLASLLIHGSEGTCDPAFQNWWKAFVIKWASVLNLVVWLDAPDTVLVERVRAREIWHTIKDKSDQESNEFLRRYRSLYDEIFRLQAAQQTTPRMLCFDTSQEPLDQVAECILTTANEELAQC